MIDVLNSYHGANRIKQALYISGLNQNAWLSGFIDGDGSFGVRQTQYSNVNDKVTKKRTAVSFRLDQRMIDPKTGSSYYDVMTCIAKFFNIKLNLKTQHFCPWQKQGQNSTLLLHFARFESSEFGNYNRLLYSLRTNEFKTS
jgi:hypothetical protein